MSEYQYYEFLALDRPLTADQIDDVRAYSSRAQISSTHFMNEYHWGDFRGDPDQFLEKYFDVMLYFANWGTHRLVIGLPAEDLDIPAWRQFEDEAGLSIRKTRTGKIILDFSSEMEEFDDSDFDCGRLMATLSGIRGEVLGGDLRPMYIGWLATVSRDRIDPVGKDAVDSPSMPAGLGDLTTSQQALAEFLRVDPDLLAAAARHSPAIAPLSNDMKHWIASLPEEEKDRMLLNLATGAEPQLGAKLQQRYRLSMGKPTLHPSLSLTELLKSANEVRESREIAEHERVARKRAQREAKEAAVREERLSRLSTRQDESWRQVDSDITSKLSKTYDHAVAALVDLRELAIRQKALDRFQSRLDALRETHRAKSAFIKKLRAAGLANG